MKSKHRRTLRLIFDHPTPLSLAWADIEALLVALGATVDNKNGSAVTFRLNGRRSDFHRPHPRKEAKPYQVRLAKEFLIDAGVKPP